MEAKEGEISGSGGKGSGAEKSKAGHIVNNRSYEETVVEVTGKASDAFMKKHDADLRVLSRRAIGSFSYRVGMADLISVFEQQVGKEVTALALRTFERNLRRRRMRPDFEYVDVCGVDGCDDDVIEEGTDGCAPCSVADDDMMMKRRMKELMDFQRRLHKRDRDDPAFG